MSYYLSFDMYIGYLCLFFTFAYIFLLFPLGDSFSAILYYWDPNPVKFEVIITLL